MKRLLMLFTIFCIFTSVAKAQLSTPAPGHLVVPTACKGVIPDGELEHVGKAIKELDATSSIADINRIDKEMAPYVPNLEIMKACTKASDEQGNLAGRYASLLAEVWVQSYYAAFAQAICKNETDNYHKLLAEDESLLKDYNALVDKYNYVVGVAKGLVAAPRSYPVYPPRPPLTCVTTSAGVVSTTTCH